MIHPIATRTKALIEDETFRPIKPTKKKGETKAGLIEAREKMCRRVARMQLKRSRRKPAKNARRRRSGNRGPAGYFMRWHDRRVSMLIREGFDHAASWSIERIRWMSDAIICA